jgi:tripartite-type tricarboxylate transporter receptor subunit TctC
MTIPRCFILSLLALVGGWTHAAESTYPEKTIRIIVGLPPGSSADIVARVLGPLLSQSLGQAVVIENVQGASGNIAGERAAKASPDGHVLLVASNAMVVINPSLFRLAYDPIKELAPICQMVEASHVLVVHPSLHAKSVNELIALAKARPGELSYASGGGGPLLTAELFKTRTGTDIRQIPYKGIVAAMPDLLAQRITMLFGPIAVVLPFVKDNRVRALAVTSLRRVSNLPQVPTMHESGIDGFESTLWYGLFAPAKTPDAVISKLYAETARALARTDVQTRLKDQGLDIVGKSPSQFASVISEETPKWARLIKDSGITAAQ